MPASSPGLSLQQLDLEAPALGPPHQHPQHHLGPVLGVGAPGPGVDVHERVAGVVAPGEQPLLLELAQPRLDRGDLLVHLGRDVGVFDGHLGQALEVLDVTGERVEDLQAAAGTGVLGADRGGPFGVLPEALGAHLGLELGYAAAQRGRVKDNPPAASSARGSRPTAGGWTRWARRWPCGAR